MPDLSDEERDIFRTVVASMTDIEDLLTEFFAGFYTRKGTDIRRYLYISWLLWGYMWWKAQEANKKIERVDNFYRLLRPLGDDDSIITFNYTKLGSFPPNRSVAFHGDCFSYIQRDGGLLIDDNQDVTEAKSLDDLEKFVNSLAIDVEKDQLLLPAIVPPSAMKPVIHHSFIARWNEAKRLLNESDAFVAVGYAFRRVDSHFNDLFRESAKGKKVIVINPDIEGVQAELLRLLNVTASSLTSVKIENVDVRRSDSLLFVPLRCEEVSDALLSRISKGW